jgi:hypothetical protein
MSDLKQAAQMALEALTIYSDAQCSIKGRNAITALKAALEQQADPPTCAWSPEDDDTMPGTYRSACGELWSFIDGGWKENRVLFCYRCGAKVVDGAHGIKEPKP